MGGDTTRTHGPSSSARASLLRSSKHATLPPSPAIWATTGVASGAAAVRQVDLDPHAVADREVVGAEEDQAAAADRVAVPRHGGLAPLARNTQ